MTEKIDGMNIRLVYDDGAMWVLGRTAKAMIPPDLMAHVNENITPSKMLHAFQGASHVILFGEGYGAKIQKGGGLYRQDQGFVLFDVWISNENGGGWWLDREAVADIASKLEVPVVPLVGTMDTNSAVGLINSINAASKSLLSDQPRPWEGIVARSHPLMLFRNGDPIMWKLKVRDFH